MRKNFAVCVAVIGPFLVLFSCSSEKKAHKSSAKLPGTWQATPVVADGKKEDWPSPLPYDNSKAMISYDVTNDKQNLYVTVITGDAATELKILRKGIVVWIDKTGNEDETTSICFPAENDKGPIRKSSRNQQGADDQGQQGQQSQPKGNDLMQAVDKSLSTAKEFFIQGFKSCRGKFNITDGDTCGIRVAVGLDEYDQLVWEAVIPFKSFYNKAEIDKRDKGKPISVCFDMLGLDKPAGQGGNGGAHQGGGMRMGMGGFGMGGMGMGMRGPGMGGGGHRGNSNNANEQLYKSFAFWHKTGIAYQE